MSQRNNSLELYVAEKLKKIYKYARPTKASGACGEEGDINNPFYIIECKQQLTNRNPVINLNTWLKLLKEVPNKSIRKPLLVIENKTGKKFAIMDLDDFIEDIVE